MKKIILSAAVLLWSTIMFAQKKVDDIAKFTAETIDLGKVKQGVPAVALFTVTNIGKEPLIIEQASPTCGCTISDYTKEPIAPGKTGTIKATYNAAAVSHIDKHLTVKFAGADDVKSIGITGDVLTVEEFDKLNAPAPAMVKAPPAAVPAKATPVALKAKPIKTVKAKKPVTVTKG
jgi:hypothetical protein